MQYKMLFNLEIISQTSIGLLYVFWKKKEKKSFLKKLSIYFCRQDQIGKKWLGTYAWLTAVNLHCVDKIPLFSMLVINYIVNELLHENAGNFNSLQCM